MRGKPIEIAELTAAAAEDQRDFDRRRHHFERLDRNSAGAEDRVDPGRLICLGPLNGLVKVGDRQRTGATGDNEVLVLPRRQRGFHLACTLFDRAQAFFIDGHVHGADNLACGLEAEAARSGRGGLALVSFGRLLLGLAFDRDPRGAGCAIGSMLKLESA